MGVVVIVIGLAIAGAGVGLYVIDRDDAGGNDPVPDVRGEVDERPTTTLPQLTTLAPPTTLDAAALDPPTTIPEPTVP